MTQKFNVWDSKSLTTELEHLIQIRYKLEEMIINSGPDITLETLPPSIIPTTMVYNIALCYEVMYEKLKEYQLLKTGNSKSTNGTH